MTTWGGEPVAWGGDPDTRWGYTPLAIRVRLEGREPLRSYAAGEPARLFAASEPLRSLTGREPSGQLVGATAATTYSGKEPGT
jgi:hypothetical protein